MIRLNAKEFLNFNLLMQRGVGSVAEDTRRRSEVMKVRDITFGMLSKLTSHFNSVKKSGGVYVGLV